LEFMGPSKVVHRRGRTHAVPAGFRRGFEEAYSRTCYRELPWFSPGPYPWIVEAVKNRWLRPPGRVLDIGCGAGSNVLWLARQGFRATGVDLAPAAIAAAEQRQKRTGVPATFRVADALRLPFRRAAFDSVTDVGCFHTLPIALRPDYAAEVARVLRREGTFLLSWVAREDARKFGPPHRPSVLEIAGTFEKEFIIGQTRFLPSRSSRSWATDGGSLAQYNARLVRRASPQPPAR
jgi:SAM-dependent methyltransferase